MADLIIFTCLRCDHNWASRLDKPFRCPHCKSVRWATLRGPSEISGVHKLLPGASITLPWLYTADGRFMDTAANRRRNLTAQTYARRHGWRLSIEAVLGGVQYFRIR